MLLLRTWVVGFALTVNGLVIAVEARAGTDPRATTKGEKIYAEKQCALCHAIHGKGGQFGPDLTDVGAKRDAQWLKAFLKDPKTVLPQAKMLPFHGNTEELEAVIAYLSALK